MSLLHKHSFRLGTHQFVGATDSFLLMHNARKSAEDYEQGISFRERMGKAATALYTETLAAPRQEWQYDHAMDFAYLACAAALFDRAQGNINSSASLLSNISGGRVSGIFDAIWNQKTGTKDEEIRRFNSSVDYMVGTAVHREDFQPQHFNAVLDKLARDTEYGTTIEDTVRFSHIVHALKENKRNVSEFVVDPVILGPFSAYTDVMPAPHGGFITTVAFNTRDVDKLWYFSGGFGLHDTSETIRQKIETIRKTNEKHALAIIDAVEGFFGYVFAMDAPTRHKAFPKIENQWKEWHCTMKEQFASEYVPNTPFGNAVMGRMRIYDCNS